MPSERRLRAAKWSPALLFGKVTAEDLDADAIEVPDGSITPAKLDREYVENSFGAVASGVLRKIRRLWIQDGDLFAEATDEF